MSDTKKWEHDCSESNALKFAEWIRDRGGVAVWKSQDLGDLAASWSTPVRTAAGETIKAPHWKCGQSTPTIHTDMNTIGVFQSEKFKEVLVKLKQSGMSLVLTDTSQWRLDRAMERCRVKHGDAWYRKGGLEFPSMEVRYTTSLISLREWLEKHLQDEHIQSGAGVGAVQGGLLVGEDAQGAPQA